VRAAWWWIDKWRQSTAFTDMTAEEQGLARNLWDELWLREDHVIPDDPRILARASGDAEAWARCGEKVLRWMRRVDGGWTNDTAIEVIAQAERRAEKQKNYRDRCRAGNADGNAAGNKPGSLSLSLSQRNNGNPPNPPAGAGGNPPANTPGARGATTQVEQRLIAYAQARGVTLSVEVVRRLRRELKAGRTVESIEAAIAAEAEAQRAEVAHRQAIQDAETWVLDRGGLNAAVEDLAAWLSQQRHPGELRSAAIDRWQERYSVPPYARSMLTARLPPTAAVAHSPPLSA